MQHHEAGKGSAPRKQQDKTAYDEGWDRIFGKKDKPKDDRGSAENSRQDEGNVSK